MEQSQGRGLKKRKPVRSSSLVNAHSNSTVSTGIAVGKSFRAKAVYSGPITNNYSIHRNSNIPLKSFFLVEYPTQIYVGNREKLDEIHGFFQAKRESASNLERTVVITGMGGIGKSELARKYAIEFKDDYRYIAWIESETENDMRNSFECVADVVGCEKDYVKLKQLTQRLYNLLNTRTESETGKPLPVALFIFDNAIQMKSTSKGFGISDYLPDIIKNSCEFHVLITSQSNFWDKQIRTIALGELSIEESLSYFSHHFGLSSKDEENVRPSLEELAKLLDGYPLTVAIAATNVDYSSGKDSLATLERNIKEYVKSFEENVLTQEMNEFVPIKYKKTIATIWKTTVSRLKRSKDGKSALAVLRQISLLLDPDIMFTTLFHLHMIGNPGAESAVLEEDAKSHVKGCLKLLDRHGLVRVNWDHESVRAHRLVKDIIFTNHPDPICVKKILWRRIQLLHSVDSDSLKFRFPWLSLRRMFPECVAETSFLILSDILLAACNIRYDNAVLILDSVTINVLPKCDLKLLVEILKTLTLDFEVTVKVILLLAFRLSRIKSPDRKDGLLELATALLTMSSAKNEKCAALLEEASAMVANMSKMSIGKFSMAEVLDTVFNPKCAGSTPSHYGQILDGLVLFFMKFYSEDMGKLTADEASQVGNYTLRLLQRWKDDPLETFQIRVITGAKGEVIPELLRKTNSDGLATWAELLVKVFWRIIPGKTTGAVYDVDTITADFWKQLSIDCDAQLFHHLIRHGFEDVLLKQLKEVNVAANLLQYREPFLSVLRLLERTLDCGLESSSRFQDILRELATFQSLTDLKKRIRPQDLVDIWVIWMAATVKCSVKNADQFFQLYFPQPQSLEPSMSHVLKASSLRRNSETTKNWAKHFLLKTQNSCSEQVRSARNVAVFFQNL